MKLFESNPTIDAIFQRALSLTIGKEFALVQNGKITTDPTQSSEQSTRRRQLLAVEHRANKDKMIHEHGLSHFKTQVMDKFYQRVVEKVNAEFDSKENIYSSTLSIEKSAPDILEILSLKAASVNRISSLTRSLSWLSNDVVTLVNKPQYRKRADVQVTNSNLALSYIGLDNLKLVMPTFILKHWLPTSTSPHPLMKRKLWNDSLAIALATQALAKQAGLDTYTAFTGGMLSNLGNLAVSRCFLTIHNEMYSVELKEAYVKRDKKLHNIMAEFDSCPELLLEQLHKHNSQVTADMVELMRFDRLQITEGIFDLAYGESLDKMCPLAKLILKAKGYVTFRNLVKEDMITPDEAKALLSAVKLSAKDIALLKKTDIDHLKLNFN